MRNSCLIGLLFSVCASPGLSQESSGPLSAIDWLSETVQPAAQPLNEPPVSGSAQAPDISVVPLSGATPSRLGLIPPDVTRLSPKIWSGSDLSDLMRLLTGSMQQRLPVGQELLITLLLAETDDLPAPHQAAAWRTARIDTLASLGAVDPALAMIEQAKPTTAPAMFQRWLDLALVAKREATPCQALLDMPALSENVAHQIYCTARRGDVDTAALLFGTSAALENMSADTETLLARFLDPDLFAQEPLPRAPVRPDPLTFRLYEAAGSPMATATLPRLFANFDLSDDAGWKAQLEAAERLARAGVLPPNRLLGLYTERKAAASGGIWDRVIALQAFDAAVQANDPDKISETLPAIWRGMKAADLQTAFSDLYADALVTIELTSTAQQIALRMQLLSRQFAKVNAAGSTNRSETFLVALAKGAQLHSGTTSGLEASVISGFSSQVAASDSIATTSTEKTGEALLMTLNRLGDAGRGDSEALRQAIADLRALGLESFARRAALQALILLEDA